jgi:CheY-like chemotaxis protein
LARARILLVEDEPFIRDLLSEVLQDAELDVTEASNGDEAIALLEQGIGFDLLLTDVHMPGRFNGVAVAQRARAMHPNVPVVFATGRPETLQTFGTLGLREADLAKPYSPLDAVKVVAALLART